MRSPTRYDRYRPRASTVRQDKEFHALVLSGGLRRPDHSVLSPTRCGRHRLRASNLQAYLSGSQQGLNHSVLSPTRCGRCRPRASPSSRVPLQRPELTRWRREVDARRRRRKWVAPDVRMKVLTNAERAKSWWLDLPDGYPWRRRWRPTRRRRPRRQHTYGRSFGRPDGPSPS